MRPCARCVGLLIDSCPFQQGRKAVIAFVAPWLIVDTILLVALLLKFLLHGPRLNPDTWVFNGDLVSQRVRTCSRPAFHQMQVFTRSPEILFRAEIGDVDH